MLTIKTDPVWHQATKHSISTHSVFNLILISYLSIQMPGPFIICMIIYIWIAHQLLSMGGEEFIRVFQLASWHGKLIALIEIYAVVWKLF